MVEINGRTMSRQLDNAMGERIMTGCIDTVTGILVQSGFVVPSVYEARYEDRPNSGGVGGTSSARGTSTTGIAGPRFGASGSGSWVGMW